MTNGIFCLPFYLKVVNYGTKKLGNISKVFRSALFGSEI